MKLNSVVDGECLHELESDTTSGQMLVGISGVRSFGVQYGHGRWKNLIGYMMVANDEIDAFFFGVRNFINGLDATIKYDNKFYTCLIGVIHSLNRNSITFVVTVGYVVVYV